MAGFRTHMTVAAGAGAVFSLGGWYSGSWSLSQAAPIAVLVAFGGILPDIDSDHSRAVRLVFNAIAVLAIITGAFILRSKLDAGALLVVCCGLYLGVRYLLSAVFKQFSVHRGIWHSWLAAGLCGLAVTAASYRLLEQPAELAWAQGAALIIGCLVHLLLDELYSVDLGGARIKRSFGTAFKPFDYARPVNSLLMLLVVAGLLPWLPPWHVLAELWRHGSVLWR
ncbi:metal-dependent hydrolase [Halomonas halocynthiae]|uniref:metal-dependent hydrolase n=1 Tax=Halomonas halocynthiae TaxID=176290 RepID=UPI00041152A2|nr:metal-dependent hydrolase [Halomonas halocynthiae]